MTTTPARRNNRKVLVPLATVLVAGAIAVGSGATFTSTTSNTISSVTSGTLTQTNSKNGAAIFTVPNNLKPGDVVNATVTLTNTGSLPAKFSLTETSSSNAFTGSPAGSNLNLTITQNGAAAGTPAVYNGPFGGLEDNFANALGTYNPAEARTYTFSVKLAQDAPNADQNKTAAATYRWDAIQLDGATSTQ